MKRLISFEILFPHKFHLYIPVEHTKGAILLCTENVRFNFERNAFKEIDLLVMDPLLVPTLADVFWDMIKQKAFDNTLKFPL